MNSLKGHISHIEQSQQIALVSVRLDASTIIKAIIIETPQSASYLKVDHPIKVLFKETEVVIGTKEVRGVSLQNRIEAKIIGITLGSLICNLQLLSQFGEIEAIISRNAVAQLSLKENMEVFAMIKLNETMLAE